MESSATVVPALDEPADTTTTLGPPSLSGRWVQLRTLVPADYPFLYELAAAPAYGYRWRARAGHPPYEEFVRTIGQGVFQQFLITTADGRRRLGLAVCYRADFRNRHAYIALQAVPEVMRQGWVLQAGALFINFLFGCYDFEKLYAESPEFVVESFRSGLGRDFVQEAHFQHHERYLGRWWDSFVFAYYRSHWEEMVSAGRLLLGTEVAAPPAPEAEPLTFPAFTEYLERQLDLDPGSLEEETEFVDGLGFDSIRMLELLSVIEELGVLLADQALGEIRTLNDAFFHYIQATG